MTTYKVHFCAGRDAEAENELRNRPSRKRWAGWNESVCKPGSVLNDHLSSPAVADGIKPPPGDGRAGLCVPVPRCCSG